MTTKRSYKEDKSCAYLGSAWQGGDVIAFVMEMEGLDFLGDVKKLSSGLKPPASLLDIIRALQSKTLFSQDSISPPKLL